MWRERGGMQSRGKVFSFSFMLHTTKPIHTDDDDGALTLAQRRG
jgi:hypothetical protein